jgi:outer membrane immunogenic protein
MSRKRKFQFEAIGRQVRMMFIAALVLPGIAIVPAEATAQKQSAGLRSPIVAVTYDLERAKTAQTGGIGFWLQGGGIDVAVPVYKRFSIAGSFSGEHAANFQPGVNLGKLSYLVGPRYTLGGSRLQVFGQGLFGGVHAFDSIFPTAGGVVSTANSYAMQLGGGIDAPLRHGFGIRVVQLDYVRTALPNNGTNSQNDFRLGFGVSYKFKRK